MKEVKVYKEYGVTSISADNDALWTKLIVDHLSDGEDVLFDFERVIMYSPWKNEIFKAFICNSHSFIRIYTAPLNKKTIDSLLLIAGNTVDGKVENVSIIVEATDSAAIKQIKLFANKIMSCITVDENETGTLRVNLRKVITQVGSKETVQAMIIAFTNILDKYKNTKLIVVDYSNVMIQTNMFKELAQIESVGKFKERGVRIEEIDITKAKVEKISIFKLVGDNYRMPAREKVKLVEELKPGAIVMLHLFKETKALNEFHQMNDGKYTISRVAMYMGMEKASGKIYIKFKSYLKDTFYTRRHYMLDNDGDTITEMETKDYKFEIDDIGYADKFTGRKAHYHLPIQYDTKDNIVTYKNEPGCKTTSVTLPEFIKMVLDDHRVNYDSALLMKCIGKTSRILSGKLNKGK